MKILTRSIHSRLERPFLPTWAGARSFLLGVSLVALGTVAAEAANSTWAGDPLANPANWSVPGNWTNGVPGSTGTTTNADIATFGLVNGGSILLDGEYNVRSLVFAPAASASTVAITAPSNNKLHLSSGGSITVQSGVVDGTLITIGTGLVLEGASATTNGSYTFSNVAKATDNYTTAAKLVISGNVSGGETTGSITLNLTGSVGARGTAASVANAISGVISNGAATGGVAVVVTSTSANQGAWNLTGLNTFTGSTTVSNNSVLFFNSIANAGVASAVGAGSTITLNSGSYFMYTGGAASTNRTINATGTSWFNNGTGALTVSSGATFQVTSSISFRGTQNFIIDALISGNGTVTRTDGGTVFLNNVNNSFSGNIAISTGVFNAKSVANSGVASAIGAGSSISLGQSGGGTTLANNIGRLVVSAPTSQSTNRSINIANGLSGGVTPVGGGIIENSVAGTTLTLGGNVTTSASSAATLELTGVGNGVLNGIISGGRPVALSKTGAGIWQLSAANTHTATNTISAGTLLVTNTTGSATGTGNVVTSGSATLGGTGTVTAAAGGSITIANGTTLMVGNTHGTAAGATASSGYTGAASRLTLGSAANVAITLAGGLQFDLFGTSNGVSNGSSDTLSVLTTASGLTLGGSITVSDQSGMANWRSAGGSGMTAGVWQIIDWSGATAATKSGTFTYTLPTSSLGIGYTWDTSKVLTDGTISVAAIADASIHRWLGTTSGSWNTAANWTAGSVPGAANDVIFAGPINQGDTQFVSTTLDLDKNVRNLLFTSAASNYSINSGSGGVLFVRGDATNGATIEVDGGTQTINADVRFGDSSSNVYIINNSVGSGGANTLTFSTITANDFDTGINITNKLLTVSGAGNTYVGSFSRRHNTYDLTLIKNGTGTLTIAGSNAADATATATGTFTGSTTINEGTIRISQERALGGNPAAYNAGHLTLNGGTLSAFANFAIDDTNRGITLGVNGGTFNVEGSNSLTVANVIAGAGGLTKKGANGTLILSAANTYTGNTNVSEGTLNIANTSGSATGTGSVLVTGTSAMLSGSGAVTASGGQAINIGNGAFLRVGNNHNSSAGTAGVLTLGSNADVALTLAGTLQFDLFGNQIGITNAEADRLVLQTTASTVNLGGVIALATPVTGSVWASGTWQLIDWSGVGAATKSGAFTFDFTNAQANLATGFTWDTSNLLTAGTVSLVATSTAHVWTGGAGTNSWKTGGNWLAGTAPTPTSDVVFQGYGTYVGGATSIVTDIAPSSADSNNTVRNLFFTGEKNYTVNATSGVLSVTGNRIEVLGGTQTFNAQVRPSTAGTFTIYNDGVLAFTSQIMTNAHENVTFEGSGNTTLSSVTRRGAYNVNLIKNGTGTVTITSYNDLDGDTGGYTANGAYIKGTTTINAGTLRINDERNLGGNPDAFNAGHLTINGGTLSAYANVTIDDANRGVTLGADGGTIATEGANTLAIANVITGSGTLTKAGTGTLSLSAINTYNGATTINAGTLLVSGSISGSAVTVNNSGTLGGSGGTTGAVTVNTGGIVSPGSNSIGQLSTQGDVTLNSGSTFKLEINSAAATADLLAITGNLSLSNSNSVVLTISDLSSAVLAEGAVFTFISYTGTWNAGLFTYNGAVISDGGEFSVGGNAYKLDYDYGGNSVALVVVPEPGAALVLMSGVGMLAGLGRFRRRGPL